MQDSHERSTNSDDQSKTANLHHLYQRRDQHNQEYDVHDVQTLLKTLPANALPPVSRVSQSNKRPYNDRPLRSGRQAETE